MQHWNGNQMVVVDVETTGNIPGHHEIWQICCLPLDSNIQVRKDVLPFYMLIQPEAAWRINWTIPVMKTNKKKIINAIRSGYDPEIAKGLFEEWMEKLNLPLNKGGTDRCKIIPLGHNYAFDMDFLKHWLGVSLYDEFFHYHPRDTMNTIAFMNDYHAMQADRVPFSKLSLRWMAHQLGVPVQPAHLHDALQDCLVTANSYRELLCRGIRV